MFTIFKDAESAVYALEAAVHLFSSLSQGDYGQACLDAVSLCGWAKNALNI